jgi:hypothetical protein
MSVDLSWTVDCEAGVWFVGCRVHNRTGVSRRVRVRSRLDGPVFPPRRSGVPEAGWDATGVTLCLDPAERRAAGFAVLAPSDEPPADPPVEVVDHEPVDEATPPVVDAEAAVRTLGEHRPPRAAAVSADTTGPSVTARESPSATAEASAQGAPARIDDWLAAVESRVEQAERLTDADLEAATEAVRTLGGVDAVAVLDDRVAADAAALRRVSERASSLAARASATELPVESLDRLA